jgi:hypothetical protein
MKEVHPKKDSKICYLLLQVSGQGNLLEISAVNGIYKQKRRGKEREKSKTYGMKSMLDAN